MKVYRVNQNIYKVSWLFLLLWVTLSGLFIIMVANRNPNWLYTLPGVVFLLLWLMYVTTYPKIILMDDHSVAFMLGSGDRIVVVPQDSLSVSDLRSCFIVNVKTDKLTKKFIVDKRKLPPELIAFLEKPSK